MTDQLKQIALRIQDLRDIAGETPEQVAATVGISTETYEAYESGDCDIPVSLLNQIAVHFGVELASLLTGEEPKLRVYTVVRKNKGIAVDRRREYDYQALASNFVHKKAEPFLVTVEPDDPDEAAHLNSHPGQEFNFVLEGTMQVTIAGHDVILNEGDSLFFDAVYEHGMKALGGTRVRFLAIIL
jgi:mannose-6-phosphate isomerase-like protein (cupin superfamily)